MCGLALTAYGRKISGTVTTHSAASHAPRQLSPRVLNSLCGLRLVILVRVELSMLLGIAELNKLLRRAANPACLALRRHEDWGRVFRHVQ